MDQKPTVGRIVHYQAYGTPGGEYKAQPRAAIVTDVPEENSPASHEGRVSLCVLNPTGCFFNQSVPYSATPKPGHWNWPPRV